MGVLYLTVVILQQEGLVAVQDAHPAGRDAGRVLAGPGLPDVIVANADLPYVYGHLLPDKGLT